jgi:alkaline phosphatase
VAQAIDFGLWCRAMKTWLLSGWLLLATIACGRTESPRDRAGRQPKPVAGPGLARNVIVFMGDGMGPEQLSTGRYAKDGSMRIDELAGPVLVDTDSLTTLNASEPELYATDSAAAATVIATGVRVINGVLSLAPTGEPLESVLEICKRAGKATGLVTTSFFFDASPAAFGAHQASRDFFAGILLQLLVETRPDVIMGSDGAWLLGDLFSGLQDFAAASGYSLVRSEQELLAWDPALHPRVLGLFTTDFVPAVALGEPYTLTPALERRPDSPDPTLATMTGRALQRLAADPDGFFLFAEDELLDEMGHRGPGEVEWVNRAFPLQAAALDDAVGVAIDWVHSHSSFEETLIVVLADHETGGYHYDHDVGPSSGRFDAFTEGEAFPAGYHTRAPTAVYALGPGSGALARVHEHADTHSLLLGVLSE